MKINWGNREFNCYRNHIFRAVTIWELKVLCSVWEVLEYRAQRKYCLCAGCIETSGHHRAPAWRQAVRLIIICGPSSSSLITAFILLSFHPLTVYTTSCCVFHTYCHYIYSCFLLPYILHLSFIHQHSSAHCSLSLKACVIYFRNVEKWQRHYVIIKDLDKKRR